MFVRSIRRALVAAPVIALTTASVAWGGFGAPVDISSGPGVDADIAVESSGTGTIAWSGVDGQVHLAGRNGTQLEVGGPFAPGRSPSVASGGDITFASYGPTFGDSDLTVTTLPGAGMPDSTVLDTGVDTDVPPAVIAPPSGGAAIVVWRKSDEIWMAQRATALAPWSAPARVSGAGQVATWFAADFGVDGTAAIAYVEAGVLNVATRPFPASAFETDDVAATGGGLNAPNMPDVEVSATGVVHVAWWQTSAGNSVVRHAERPAGTGTSFTAPQTLNTSGNAQYVSLAVDGPGRWLAAWRQGGADPSNDVVVARSWDGTSLGAPVTLSAALGASVLHPRAAVDDQGRAVVAWGRPGFIESAERDSLDGAFSDAVTVSGGAESVGQPDVAFDGNGIATVVWPGESKVRAASSGAAAAAPAVQFTAPTFTGVEGDAITVSLSRTGGASNSAVRVVVSDPGGDVPAFDQVVSFGAAATSASVQVPTTEDATDEQSPEGVNITLSAVSHATITGPNPALLLVQDDDEPSTGTPPGTGNPNPVVNPTPIPETPLPITQGAVLDTVESIRMPNVAPFKQGLLQRFVRLVDAKSTLDATGANLSYKVVRVPIGKVPAAYRTRIKPEDVIAQTPAPGTKITTDLLTTPDSVKLTVYDPNMEPKPKVCDYGDVAAAIRGMELASARKYIAHERCDSHVVGVADLRATDEYVKSAVVARDPAPKGKIGKEYIFVKYAEPKKADLALVFREEPTAGTVPPTVGSFSVSDWALTATRTPQTFTVQVVEKTTGQFVKGAMVSLSADGRSQDFTSVPSLSPSGANGEVTFRVTAPDPGTISIDAIVYGVNGRNAEGFADILVKNRKGADVTTPSGRVMRVVHGRYVEQPALTKARSARAARAAYKVPPELQRIEDAYIEIIRPIVELSARQALAITFTTTMNLRWAEAMKQAEALLPAGFLKVSSRELDLSAAKLVDAGLLRGGTTLPITFPNANVISTGGGNFQAGTGPAIQVGSGTSALVLSGNGVIATGGGNVIATGGGNVIATGGGNFTDATKGASVIATGGGNVIATGGGNVIATGGGNVIATGGGNIIPVNGGQLTGIAAGNVISTGGGNFR